MKALHIWRSSGDDILILDEIDDLPLPGQVRLLQGL
jgi:transcriptional regulator with AAA-type ATPase domain